MLVKCFFFISSSIHPNLNAILCSFRPSESKENLFQSIIIILNPKDKEERSDGVVVITSALHAEGREFDPRSEYFFLNRFLDQF